MFAHSFEFGFTIILNMRKKTALINIHFNGFEFVCFVIIACLKKFEKVSTEFLYRKPLALYLTLIIRFEKDKNKNDDYNCFISVKI